MNEKDNYGTATPYYPFFDGDKEQEQAMAEDMAKDKMGQAPPPTHTDQDDARFATTRAQVVAPAVHGAKKKRKLQIIKEWAAHSMKKYPDLWNHYEAMSGVLSNKTSLEYQALHLVDEEKAQTTQRKEKQAQDQRDKAVVDKEVADILRLVHHKQEGKNKSSTSLRLQIDDIVVQPPIHAEEQEPAQQQIRNMIQHHLVRNSASGQLTQEVTDELDESALPGQVEGNSAGVISGGTTSAGTTSAGMIDKGKRKRKPKPKPTKLPTKGRPAPRPAAATDLLEDAAVQRHQAVAAHAIRKAYSLAENKFSGNRELADQKLKAIEKQLRNMRIQHEYREEKRLEKATREAAKMKERPFKRDKGHLRSNTGKGKQRL